jgi:hypothetical protein
MDETTSSYRGHRFPPLIISHAVWLYHRFSLSFRDVEDLAGPLLASSLQRIDRVAMDIAARRFQALGDTSESPGEVFGQPGTIDPQRAMST